MTNALDKECVVEPSSHTRNHADQVTHPCHEAKETSAWEWGGVGWGVGGGGGGSGSAVVGYIGSWSPS